MFCVSNYKSVLFDLFEFIASSTDAAESSHGADTWSNANIPRTAPHPESTTVLPWPKTHENSKTPKPKQSSNVRFTSRGSPDSTNDRTRTTPLHSSRAKPTVSSTACKCEPVKTSSTCTIRGTIFNVVQPLWSNHSYMDKLKIHYFDDLKMYSS